MAGTSESSSVAPFFFPVPHYKGRQPPDNMRGSPKDNSLLTAGRPTTPLSGSLRSALGLAPPGLGAISDNEATVVKTSRRKSPERLDNYLNTEEVISSFLYDMSVATDRSRVRWLDEQCKGLAEGLRGIHNTKLSSSHESGLQPPILDEKNCGRHGDIKPQNDLWFRQEKGAQGDHGVLKISDFGLTRFHSAITTKVSPNGIPVSQTYKAPEIALNEDLSRPFDVRTLGCLYLEFITWILTGWEGLHGFDQSRFAEKDSRTKFNMDLFYNLNRHQGATTATVKTTVINVRSHSTTSRQDQAGL